MTANDVRECRAVADRAHGPSRALPTARTADEEKRKGRRAVPEEGDGAAARNAVGVRRGSPAAG
ncbi:hypothetical protein, partial [Streptomyces rochei]|uniref:hypothetical protein n=1 Tax=Streptomyces rochei TaxID=1928 RepID=UPI00194540D9